MNARFDSNTLIRRSALSVPADKEKFIEKAWTRNADVITLDLEDGVSADRKAAAREALAYAVPAVGKGGSAVAVRVNNEPDLLWDDLEAAVRPGVNAVALPKMEDPEQLIRIEKEIGRLEAERGMAPGSVATTIAIETAFGFLHMEELARATVRGISLGLGVEDFTREIGMEVVTGDEILFARQQMVVVACAYGLQAKGLIGRMTDYRDLEGMFQVALRSNRYGLRGTTCIHPNQVEICNRAFRPQPEAVEKARRVVEAMAEAEARGSGTTSLDGRMIDKPVAERYGRILARHQAAEDYEAHKRACRAAAGFEEDPA